MQHDEPPPVAPASRHDASESLEIPAGEWIYREDEPGSELFIIESGEVDLTARQASDTGTAIRLGPGEFFGQASVCGERVRGESARAHTACRLLAIHRDHFADVLRAEPGIALVMIERLDRQAGETRASQLAPTAAGESSESVLPAAAAGAVEAVLAHLESGRQFALAPGDETTLGRAGSAIEPDIDLSDIDPHATVSRSHAVILKRPEGLCVVEMKPSTNGTFVDGERVSVGVEVPLSPGCKLMLGSVEMTLELR